LKYVEQFTFRFGRKLPIHELPPKPFDRALLPGRHLSLQLPNGKLEIVNHGNLFSTILPSLTVPPQ
jgi:hypothetical protein